MDGGYDLQVEPWIPVLLLSGQRERLGLRDVFKRAHEIDELEVPVPPRPQVCCGFSRRSRRGLPGTARRGRVGSTTRTSRRRSRTGWL